MQPADGATGDRADAKVRRVAARYRPQLGELVHVEAARPGWRLLAVFAGFWAVLTGIVAAGPSNTLGNTVLMATLFAVMMGLLGYLIGSEKMLVLERGVVLGSFVVGTRPMALPFEVIDPSSLRASLGIGGRNGYEKVLRGHSGYDANHAFHHCLWAPYAVSFIGPLDVLVRGTGRWSRARRITPLAHGEALIDSLWTFGVSKGDRLEPLVAVLASTMRRAGVEGIDDLEAAALPPRRLTGVPADAEYLGIPDWQRP